MNPIHDNPPDDLLDLAISPEDSPAQRRAMLETLGHLAAASPHVHAAPDLRARILQATAPQTFNLDQYRKAARDNSWLYKWGFYAAMLFLMAGAYYNLSMQANLKNLQIQANNALQQKDAAIRTRDVMLSQVFSSDSQQVNLKQNNQVVAKAFVNQKNQQALVVVPQGMIPSGQSLVWSMPDTNKQMVPFQTTVVEATQDIFHSAPVKQNLNLTNLAIHDVQPDGEKPVYAAEWPQWPH